MKVTRDNWRVAVDAIALIEQPDDAPRRMRIVESVLHSLVVTALQDGPEAMLERLEVRLAKAMADGPRETWSDPSKM